MNQAIDTYVNLVWKLTVNFFSSLIPTKTPDITPYLSEECLLFVMTQILPLQPILQSQTQLAPVDDISIEANRVIIDTLRAKIVYDHPMYKNVDLSRLVDPAVLKKLAELREKLRVYVQQQIKEATREETMYLLKQLALKNNLFLTNLPFNQAGLNQLSVLIVWLLTAYADWYGVEMVDTQDVLGMMSMMMVYEDQKDVLRFFGSLHSTDVRFTKPIQTILNSVDIYISEPALAKLAGMYEYMSSSKNDAILKGILKTGEYICAK